MPGHTHRDADDARAVPDDFGDSLRSGELRSHDEVSLVLTILVVGHDNELAHLHGLDGRHDRGAPKLRHLSQHLLEKCTSVGPVSD